MTVISKETFQTSKPVCLDEALASDLPGSWEWFVENQFDRAHSVDVVGGPAGALALSDNVETGN